MTETEQEYRERLDRFYTAKALVDSYYELPRRITHAERQAALQVMWNTCFAPPKTKKRKNRDNR